MESKILQFIGTTPTEMQDAIRQIIIEEVKGLKQGFQPKEPKEYLTRSDISKLLSIDISTVHNWTKKGKLKAYGIGNRVYYLRTEVEASIIPIN